MLLVKCYPTIAKVVIRHFPSADSLVYELLSSNRILESVTVDH